MRAEQESDADLLARSRTSPEALGVIYQRHATAVFRFLARRVGPAAAEDLLSEVFAAAVGARLRAWSHDSGSALPWLYGIAGNVVRSHRRRGSPRLLSTEATVVDWDEVDARLDAVARRAELRTALDALTDGERDVLLLVAWEGLAPAEAAEALGITPLAARSSLHRARTRAQAALDELALFHPTAP